jgi:ribosome biogenesis GTPase / thiamine phosphate phosphatase
MNLIDLGLSSFHKDKLDFCNDFNEARVVSVNKESYIINDGSKEYFAKLTGNMLYTSESPEDFPTVGDFVLFQSFEDDSLAIIHKTLERKSLLKRKTPGKKIEFQLIATNLDFAIIIQSLDSDFNPKRLERYLAMVNEFEIEPIILFSKADLIDEDERNKIITNIKSSISDLKVISFSNFNDSGVEQIKSVLLPKKTYCLIGSSGVGKTTLLNNLIGRNEFKTKEVREKDNKGKHSTTNRQLVVLKNGAMIIDTPGMRELGNISISDGIDKTFDEISDLSSKCKFADCSHTVEKGCAILEALENGTLDKGRYENYIKLRKESDYYERSYLEKRKKDKEFGKMIKSVMKNKNKNR